MRKLKKYVINNKKKIILVAITILIILFRFSAIFFIPNIFSDESEVINQIISILKTGYDVENNYLPFYVKIGAGIGTYTYIYPMVILLKFIGVDINKARLIQLILNVISCLLISISVKRWTNNSKHFWYVLFVSLTLPWGFYQANRVWDPSFVIVYFSLYFYFFSKLMKSNNITEFGRYAYSSLAGAFLVLLAVVYPVCRIPAVAMWIYSVVWAFKDKKINVSQIFVMVIISSLLSFQLLLNLFDNNFNKRATDLLVFQGGMFYQELFQLVRNFCKLFDFSFLFITGDINSNHSLPIFGVLGTISIIPLVKLFKEKLNSLSIYMIFIIILTNISTALTNEGQPHSLRSCLCILPYSILIAFGWYKIIDKSENKVLWYNLCTLSFIIYYLFFVMIGKGIISLPIISLY